MLLRQRELLVLQGHLIGERGQLIVGIVLGRQRVVVNRMRLVLELGVFILCEIQHVLRQGQDRCEVGDVHDSVANMHWENLGVRVAGDVGLDWDGNVAKVEYATVPVGVEECQIYPFVSVEKRLN